MPGIFAIAAALLVAAVQTLPATATSVTEIFSRPGTTAGDYLGLYLAPAGDLNDDGWPDFAVGASRGGISGAGQTMVYFGGPGLDAEPEFVLEGEMGLDQFGLCVAGLGDVNDDGFDDLVVGAPTSDAAGLDAGRAYVYFGGPAFDATADLVLDGDPGDQFGWSVAGPGDLDGGGADIVVGAPGAGSVIGRAYVFQGGAALDDSVDVIIEGPGTSRFGWFMNKAGDYDADGWPDLLIGANTDRYAYLVRGGADFDNTIDFIFTAEGWGDRIGYGLGPAGDFNGDGYDDIVIGAMHNDTTGEDAGRAYLYYGGPAADTVADLTFTGLGDHGLFGRAVHGAGDLNHDGFTDLVIGAPTPDNAGYGPGETFVYFGGDPSGPNPPDAVADLYLVGEADQDRYGTSVAIVGDVTGDGRADFLSGANLHDGGGLLDTGKFYLYSVPNDAPIAVADTFTVSDGATSLLAVLDNDEDPDGALDPAGVVLTLAPLHGSAVPDTLTGRIDYTPLPGYLGADSLAYTVTDDEGAVSTPATVLLEVTDATPPSAVAVLIADPDAGGVVLSWSGVPADADSVQLWRAVWRDTTGASAYPLYDDAPGNAPALRPLDHATAVTDTMWTPVVTLPTAFTGWNDALTERGVYSYEIFARDTDGNWGPGTDVSPRATSYILGDAAEGGDGTVDHLDALALFDVYGTAAPDTGFAGVWDIGPTDDGTARGIPLTDGRADFEDAMVLAMNHTGGAGAAPDGSVVDLSWRRRADDLWVLMLETPHPGLQGLRLTVAVPAGVDALVEPGDLLTTQAAPLFLADAPGDSLDVALVALGGGATLDGTGELLRIRMSAAAWLDTPGTVARTVDNTNLPTSFAAVSGVPGVASHVFALDQNSPNPFNPQTTIRFTLAEAGRTRLRVYDIRGRLVTDLMDTVLPSGSRTVVWDGRDDTGVAVGSGVYLYRLETTRGVATRSMTLLK